MFRERHRKQARSIQISGPITFPSSRQFSFVLEMYWSIIRNRQEFRFSIIRKELFEGTIIYVHYYIFFYMDSSLLFHEEKVL